MNLDMPGCEDDDDKIPLGNRLTKGELKEYLDAGTEILQILTEQIRSAITSQLVECQQCERNCRDIITGSIGKRLDDCFPAYSKCANKLKGHCLGQLTEAYGYSALCGLGYPTNDQVIYGLESGDYLGSWEFCPGASPPPPPPPVPPQGGEAETLPTPRIVVGGQGGRTPTDVIVQPPITEQTVDIDVEPPKEGTAKGTVNTIQQLPTGTPRDIIDQTLPQIEKASRELSDDDCRRFFADPTNAQIAKEVTPDDDDFELMSAEYQVCWVRVYGQEDRRKEVEEGHRKQAEQDAQSCGGLKLSDIPWMIDWSSITSCQDMEAQLKRIVDLKLPLGEALGFCGKKGETLQGPAWFLPIYNALPVGAEALYWMLKNGFDGLGSFIKNLPSSPSCNFQQMVLPIAAKAVVGVFNWIAGGALDDLMRAIGYGINYACPTDPPSVAEANRAFLSGTIDKDQWKCWVRAGNVHDKPMEKIVEADRTIPSIHDAITLFRFAKIDEARFDELIRANGVIKPQDKEDIISAAVAWPGISDLIRMMVRDVADDEVVKKLDLDLDFSSKWQGALKDYGDAIGVNEEIAKLYWRAHWEQVSNTQAYEMLHRLRPDRVPEGIVTDVDTVKELLAVNDVAPFWRDRLIAISYHPLTRTDAQRAFMIGAIGEEELGNVYQDEGYTKGDADILVRFTKRLKVERDARKMRRPEFKWVLTSYRKGLIDRGEALDRIGAVTGDPALAETLVKQEELKKKDAKTARYLKHFKYLFLTGQEDWEDLVPRILNLGLTPNDTNEIREMWQLDLIEKGKSLSAAQLCKLRELNLITQKDQMIRLGRLGYKAEEAKRIAQLCEDEVSGRAMKKIMAELKDQERKRKEEAAAETRKRKESERNREKYQRRVDTKLDKAEKRAEKAEKAAEKAEEKDKKEKKGE